MADRLSIEKRINEEIVPIIDNTQFLGLDKGNTDRIGLFLFAMALGIKEGKRTPLRVHDGLILESSIKSVDGAFSYIFSVLVDELRKINEEDKIDNKQLAFQIAEEYANTGFLTIEKWLSKINNDDDIEALRFSLIEEMDEKLQSIVDELAED